MPLYDYIERWVKEPPPEYIFEVSERALAYAQPRGLAGMKVRKLDEKALAPSPSQPNLLRADLLQASLPAASKGNAQQRRIKAALVVPDYAARMSVLDFEELPADAEQREALIRFRLRKSVPFSIDDARISATLQWHEPQSKRVEVLAAAISNHVLEEYETILTSKGYQVGMVVPSSVAALNLCSAAPNGFTIFAKLSGSVLSVLLLQGQMVRVVRCVDLSMEDASAGDDAAVIGTLLHQTFAFVEDEYSERVERFLLCGFGESTEELGKAFEAEFRVQWGNLASRFGAVLPDNAGLLGLAEQYAA